jgi:hypothetical protein
MPHLPPIHTRLIPSCGGMGCDNLTQEIFALVGTLVSPDIDKTNFGSFMP